MLGDPTTPAGATCRYCGDAADDWYNLRMRVCSRDVCIHEYRNAVMEARRESAPEYAANDIDLE